MASEPTRTRAVRLVASVACGALAVILGWPFFRGAPAAAGIGVFPPPGTDPPQSGIIVPDDYVLPPGYIRHHQTTDDGKRLPPILMFHPDYHPVDDRGRPIPLPADRVVPPDMAPPGLPHDLLRVPPAHVPSAGESPR